MPGPGELSATIFIEYPGAVEREQMMVRLAGVDDKFYLVAGGERARLVPDTRGTDSTRTIAVHYLKFVLGERAREAIQRVKPQVLLGVDHPAYSAEAELSASTLASSRNDLA